WPRDWSSDVCSSDLAGEALGHVEGLGEEALELPRPRHRQLVLVRELFHAEDGDDVLEGFRAADDIQKLLGDALLAGLVVLDGQRSEERRVGKEWRFR